MTISKTSGGRSHDRFAHNWIKGAQGNSLRRRLFAVLRMAHRALGVNRKNLGLGSLGSGGVSALLVAMGVATAPAAFAQTAVGTGAAALGAPSIAIADGVDAATAYGTHDLAIGAFATAGVGGTFSTDEIAIGTNSGADGTGAIAIGGGGFVHTRANAMNDVAIGSDSVANAANAVTPLVGAGFTSYAGTPFAVFSVGSTNFERQIQMWPRAVCPRPAPTRSTAASCSRSTGGFQRVFRRCRPASRRRAPASIR